MNVAKFTAAAFLALGLFQTAYGADQLDGEARKAAPAGVLVRIDTVTKKAEFFRAEKVSDAVKNNKADQATLDAAVASIAVPANKIGEMDAKHVNELDRDSTTEACFGWWWGGYRCCGGPVYYYNYAYTYSYGWGFGNRFNYGWYGC